MGGRLAVVFGRESARSAWARLRSHESGAPVPATPMQLIGKSFQVLGREQVPERINRSRT
ncbi:hypothetical protein AK973_5252 [Pseudomonas brassicacearum]|nr:hypothetical protein AK973_5252 [Pseudomonas brassicacearum]EIK57913.1 hypothetical protein PflQ8_4872 [Pseudomonas fluorescens Q8r1-96]